MFHLPSGNFSSCSGKKEGEACFFFFPLFREERRKSENWVVTAASPRNVRSFAARWRRSASRYRSQKWCKTTRCHCRLVLPCQESSISRVIHETRERKRGGEFAAASSSRCSCSRNELLGLKALVLKIGRDETSRDSWGDETVRLLLPVWFGRFSLVKIVQKTFLEESW